MLIWIASSDNSRIKLVRKLSTRKGRAREKKFVIEGLNLCREAVRRSLDVDFIMIPEGWQSLGGSEDISGIRGFIEECIDAGSPAVCIVSDGIFENITDAGAGIGILGVLNMPDADKHIIEELKPDTNILVLDRIQDPGNLGTMIRTAAAAGYGMILAAKGTADVYSPKVLRSTAGMVFDLPVVYMESSEELHETLKSSGRRIVVTDPAGGIPYYKADLSRGTALVIGNEGNGISDGLMALSDVRVTIPMSGGTESLNAAVSAAILMYEAVRKED